MRTVRAGVNEVVSGLSFRVELAGGLLTPASYRHLLSCLFSKTTALCGNPLAFDVSELLIKDPAADYVLELGEEGGEASFVDLDFCGIGSNIKHKALAAVAKRNGGNTVVDGVASCGLALFTAHGHGVGGVGQQRNAVGQRVYKHVTGVTVRISASARRGGADGNPRKLGTQIIKPIHGIIPSD